MEPIRRMSMNTSLKNARIFDDVDWEEVDSPISNEEADIKPAIQSTPRCSTTPNLKKIKEESEEDIIGPLKKQQDDTFEEGQLEDTLPEQINQESGSCSDEEHPKVKPATPTHLSLSLKPSSSESPVDRMFDESPYNKKMFNALKIKEETPVKAESQDWGRNKLKSAKRTVFDRQSPYKKIDETYDKRASVKSRLGPKINSEDEESGPRPKKYPKKEMETDPDVLARREKQIEYGKNTLGYENYCKTVPSSKKEIESPWAANISHTDNEFSTETVTNIKIEPEDEPGEYCDVKIKFEKQIKEEPQHSSSLLLEISRSHRGDLRKEELATTSLNKRENVQRTAKRSEQQCSGSRRNNHNELFARSDKQKPGQETERRNGYDQPSSSRNSPGFRYFNAVGSEEDRSEANFAKNNSRESRKSAKNTVFNRFTPYTRRGTDEDESGSPVNKKRKEMETDPSVIARREKQIEYGKNTIGYENYIRQVPKRARKPEEPQTPPKYVKYSRRAWEGLVKKWRIQLHKYDQPSEDNPENEAS